MAPPASWCLAGELLKEAEQLINQKIHPMTIISGERRALAHHVWTLNRRVGLA